MKLKRGIFLVLLLSLFLINFANAQLFNRYYSGAFDESLLIYGGLVVLLFAIINFALSKTRLGQEKGTRVVISLVISILSVYYMSKKSFGITTGNFYLGGFYFGDFFPSFLTIIFLIAIIYFIVKWGFKNVLMVLGALLVLLSFTNLVYEKNLLLWLGIAFLIIGFILKMKKPKWADKPIGGGRGPGRNTTREERRRQREIRKRARNIARIRARRLRRDQARQARRRASPTRITRKDRLLPQETSSSREARHMRRIQKAMRRKRQKELRRK